METDGGANSLVTNHDAKWRNDPRDKIATAIMQVSFAVLGVLVLLAGIALAVGCN